MAEVTEREYKKLVGAAGYFAREVVSATEAVEGANRKAERAAAEAADAIDGIARAEQELVDAQARHAAAVAEVEAAVIVVPDLDDDAPPAAGAQANDATIRVENGE